MRLTPTDRGLAPSIATSFETIVMNAQSGSNNQNPSLLPVELWLKTATWLPKCDLLSLSVCSRFMRNILLGPAFYSISSPNLVDCGNVNKAFEILSDASYIHPFIRQIHLFAEQPRHFGKERLDHQKAYNSFIICNINKVANLHILVLKGFNISKPATTKILAHPTLSHLLLSKTFVEEDRFHHPSQTIPTSNISCLVLQGVLSIPHSMIKSLAPTLTELSLDNLGRTIGPRFVYESCLEAIYPNLKTFSLIELRNPIMFDLQDSLKKFLHNHPKIRKACLLLKESWDISGMVLPNLAEIECWWDNLPQVASRSKPIHKVSLFAYTGGPSHVPPRFEQGSCPHTLELVCTSSAFHYISMLPDAYLLGIKKLVIFTGSTGELPALNSTRQFEALESVMFGLPDELRFNTAWVESFERFMQDLCPLLSRIEFGQTQGRGQGSGRRFDVSRVLMKSGNEWICV